MRQNLRMLLNEGYSPLSLFSKDFKKYFYLAELMSLVDLSTVRWMYCCNALVAKLMGLHQEYRMYVHKSMRRYIKHLIRYT